jgi:hypothetical protein
LLPLPGPRPLGRLMRIKEGLLFLFMRWARRRRTPATLSRGWPGSRPYIISSQLEAKSKRGERRILGARSSRHMIWIVFADQQSRLFQKKEFAVCSRYRSSCGNSAPSLTSRHEQCHTQCCCTASSLAVQRRYI